MHPDLHVRLERNSEPVSDVRYAVAANLLNVLFIQSDPVLGRQRHVGSEGRVGSHVRVVDLASRPVRASSDVMRHALAVCTMEQVMCA